MNYHFTNCSISYSDGFWAKSLPKMSQTFYFWQKKQEIEFSSETGSQSVFSSTKIH